MMVTSPGARLYEPLCFREPWAGQSSARSGPMRRGQDLEWFTFSVPSKGTITSFKGSVKRMAGKLKPYASGRSDVRRGNAPSLPWGCAEFKGQWCEWLWMGITEFFSHNTKSRPLLFSAAMTPSPCPPAGHRGRRLKEYKFCPNHSSREMALYPAGLQAEVSGSSVSTRK